MADFGLMLKQNDSRMRLDELISFNQLCIEALSARFTTLWMEDHLQWGPDVDTFECLSTLNYLAAQYPHLRIGSLVLCQSFRNPALLAKVAANLQALTGGRFILGLGAGWKEDEYRSYGYDFPTPKARLEQLEEAVQVMRALWTQPKATFEGRHYQISNASCTPRPDPPIPVLIGGGGEKKTLAIVARHADWWNFNSCTAEEYERKVAILHQHCERIDRDPSTIKLTYLSTLSISRDPAEVQRVPNKHYIAGTPAEVTEELQRFQQIGVSHFVFRILDLKSLSLFNREVLPRLQ
jgi:alkanesulfonate monooxygenase SsuD/methylene tetrahydromethanopterin reductase-like flavin-dependent oxidoreductase (luciferase family)